MTVTHEDLFKKCMKNPEFQTEYEKFDPEIALLDILLAARKTAKLTQEEIATRMGTTREVVARLESPRRKSSPTLKTLGRYVEACGARLEFKIVKQAKTKSVSNKKEKMRS